MGALVQANCRLCQQRKPLVDSHVIPEFVWDPVMDDHKMVAFTATGKARRLQKGLRERLLCEECDNGHLNRHFEQPSRSTWQHLAGQQEDASLEEADLYTSSGRRFFTVSGIDYLSFKLFLLSVLWRAGVSTHAVYSQVSLGAKHEERLRRMLLERDAGAAKDYPFILCRLREPFLGITAPERIRPWNGHTCYRMILTSVAAIFVVSSQELPLAVRAMALQENGLIRMPEMALEEFGGVQSMIQMVKTTQVPDRWL